MRTRLLLHPDLRGRILGDEHRVGVLDLQSRCAKWRAVVTVTISS